jgi:hypothetical protein
MKRKNMRIARLAMPVMIAMLALVPGPSSVRANDQPSAATAEAGTYPYYCTIYPKMTGKAAAQ